MTEKRELLPYEVWKERYAYREITDKEVKVFWTGVRLPSGPPKAFSLMNE